jgi:hypothetical protein
MAIFFAIQPVSIEPDWEPSPMLGKSPGTQTPRNKKQQLKKQNFQLDIKGKL